MGIESTIRFDDILACTISDGRLGQEWEDIRKPVESLHEADIGGESGEPLVQVIMRIVVELQEGFLFLDDAVEVNREDFFISEVGFVIVGQSLCDDAKVAFVVLTDVEKQTDERILPCHVGLGG